MAWTDYEDAAARGGRGKKQTTSPVYTFSGTMGTGTQPTPPVTRVTDTGAGYSAAVSPYGAQPLAGNYAASANVIRQQTGQQLPYAGALTPEQLASIGSQMVSANAAASAAAANLPIALRSADIDYFGNLRQARQAGTAATQDWRAILAGAGMGRSPALGLMQLERIRGGLTGREIELAAAREAAKAAARQEARDAQATAAATRANLAQQTAMYETGNINKYLEQLFGGYLPTNG